MTEEQMIKLLCKQVVDRSNKPLTQLDKELIKQVIDVSKTPEEMILGVLAILKNKQ